MGHSDTEVAGERDVLVASLDDARHAVLAALTGVPVALLREPLIWPDGSLLAIVKHLAHLERWWFAHTFAGLDMRFPRPGTIRGRTGASSAPTQRGASWRSTAARARRAA